MYATFREDVDPRILTCGIGGRSGEGVSPVRGVCVDMVWRGEGVRDVR